MRKPIGATAAATLAVLFLATATQAASVDATVKGRAQIHSRVISGDERAALKAYAAMTPRGFSRGRKVGWRGRHSPPGWFSHGRRVGWHHGAMPPGLRRH